MQAKGQINFQQNDENTHQKKQNRQIPVINQEQPVPRFRNTIETPEKPHSKLPKVKNFLQQVFSVDPDSAEDEINKKREYTKAHTGEESKEDNDKYIYQTFHTIPQSQPYDEDILGQQKFNRSNQPGDIEKQAEKAVKFEEEKLEEKSERKLDFLLDSYKNPIFKTKTMFPLDLFPDELIIYLDKIDIITKEFLKSGSVHSIVINKIKEVTVESSPFLSKLLIVDDSFTQNTTVIENLKTKDAIKARSLIQGLIFGEQQGIDFTTIQSEDLVSKIEELGRTKSL